MTTVPTSQNAIDIFKGAWTSKFPAWTGLEAGPLPLFEDDRMEWLVNAVGGVRGKKILELGPLEGAHTAMLHNFGAREIVAIEANPGAYLRCLVTKEILQLATARFLLGDINAYMESTQERFDICVGSGILYHMLAPVQTLESMSRMADSLFLWTHYYDESVCAPLSSQFPNEIEVCEWRQLSIPMHKQCYGAGRSNQSFCGGAATYSMWLKRSSIECILRELGFSNIKEMGDTLTHPNGPAVSLLALR